MNEYRYESCQSFRGSQRHLLKGLLLLGCLGTSPLLAEDLEPLPEGFGLIVALPGATRDLGDRALIDPPAELTKSAQVPVAWIELEEPRLMDPLRRAVHEHTETPDWPRCSLDVPQLATVVAQLESAINFLDFESAGRELERIDAAFACEEEPVHAELLGRYAFLHGLIERRGIGSDGGWFAIAASLAPTLELVRLHSEEVKMAFSSAADQTDVKGRIPVQVALDQAGLQVWLDGIPTTVAEVSLLPGAHFLQLVDERGRATRGGVVTLDGTAEATANTSLLARSRLEVPPPESILVRVREAVHSGRLDPVIGATLATLLGTGRHPWMLLIEPESGTRPARGLWLLPGGATASVRLSEGVSRSGIGVTAALATVTAASGAGLMYFLSPLFTRAAVQDPDPYYAGSIGTGVGLLIGLGATAVSASRTWHFPRRWYLPQPVPRPEAQPGSPGTSLMLRTGAGWLALEVKWP